MMDKDNKLIMEALDESRKVFCLFTGSSEEGDELIGVYDSIDKARADIPNDDGYYTIHAYRLNGGFMGVAYEPPSPDGF